MSFSTLASGKADFAYSPVINFALQQNHVPVIKALKIHNTTNDDWRQVTVEISTEPNFAITWRQTIEFLGQGQEYEFERIPLVISSKYLAELTERVSGNFILTVTVGSEVVLQNHYRVDLLAYDQWNGVGLLPEMLAAFITPNHPEIPHIIRKASSILQKWTGSPSFDEYQSRNPNRVRKQMAAIYEAIADMQLVYCSTPASFEESGQRVRLADAIFSNKLANCLDLSLLYAACLEAVGIHPLVVIIKGHAFAGAWLIDESFADVVNDDPSLITKRTADGINEIAVVEATCMNAGSQASFDEAVKLAEQKMLHTSDFVLFIDVKRARFASIRPLPLRIATPAGWEIQEEEKTARENTLPEDIYVGERLINVDKIEVSKQRLWERKLLDLTLRNSLLNVRVTKSVIQFVTINVGELEDALANGDEFQVLAKPSDWDNPLRDAGLYQALHQTDPIADLVKHELTHKRIRTYLSDVELNGSLTNIYRSSRLSLEENGANTLYIGLGLLKWFETEASERPRYAPILLVPVEIIRKSAQKGYIIRSREEETIMNITLLEMIRQDFGVTIGGLETLPKDHSGIDVKAVFNIVRQAVMSKSRWDVEEQAILGTFSFSKFILWNDIHNNADELRKNKVVASLMSGKLEWQPDESTASTAILDGQLHPADIALPISTDSSQLAAIFNAAQGKSFVLHGPPGTGKSQTITNIIANALYAGKRVLFVAAKKAALEVVENRLESIGIGPFCLELHSNKSKKSAVLEQLKAATQMAYKTSPENFKQEADRLFVLRKELNAYVEALHQKYPFGYSLFDLFTGYSRLPQGTSEVSFSADTISTLNSSQVQSWNDLAEELQHAGQIIGRPGTHPLKALHLKQYTPQVKQEAKQLIESLQKTLADVAAQGRQVSSALKLAGQVKSKAHEDTLVQLTNLFLQLGDVPASVFKADAPEQTLAQLTGVATHGRQRNQLRSELLKQYQKDILNFPAAQTLTEWNIAADKWFLPRWFRQNTLVKSIRQLAINGQTEKEDVPQILNRIIQYQEEQEYINKATYLPTLLGFLWQNGDGDWERIAQISQSVIEINRAASAITGTNGVKEWRHQIAAEFEEGSQQYVTHHASVFEQYLQQINQLKTIETSMQQLLNINFNTITNTEGDWKETLLTVAGGWLQHIDSLKDWYNWLAVKDKGVSAGLQPLVTAFENGTIGSSEIALQYQKGFYHSAADFIIEKNPQLATFSGGLFQEKIKKFREISKRFEELTKEELYARLAGKIPSFTQEASQSSEIGMLQRAIRNNGRAMSIRKIFDSIPNLLPRLTPCMLMSPISVAQYFDASSEKFDLVIFDEASQMPTCEAVGAVARGSHVIVVGDPKQMPPTSFFSTNNIDDDNIEKEDMESILDDCLALSMPSQHLLWHYRSKHESLIAFSNAKYYDNQLLTFPSTDDISTKVQFVKVEGYYDKGKTRQNKFEAKAIVDEVVRRLSDPELAKRSMGIVTFSSVQQALVDDLLTDVFKLRPDLEKIALESGEPLFIKNLENVQGDERDVILFSIGYGPDENGRVSLNFGPINREGGWRRLNVAVSRARYEMKVFSTLTSDQIDTNRTSSEGVAGLKAFLAYAEKGRTALPVKAAAQAKETASFENRIAEEIRKKGYEVHTQIGSSAYKIDLGIVDRDNPSQYVLGVLTDGKNYHSATTSKDREIIQVDVLHMLGWNIYKIWSTEWWENPDKVLSGILEAIKQAEESNKLRPQPQVSAPTAINPSIASESLAPKANVLNSLAPAVVNVPVSKPTMGASALPYQVAQVEIVPVASADEFLMPQNRGKIKAQIFNVLEAESPISKNLLSKRVLAAWGISRMGTRVSGHFDALFTQMDMQAVISGKNTFFWKKGQQPDSYSVYRIAQQEAQKREADDLSPEEVANAVKEILKNQISLSRADLVRETSKLFGYARIGANVENAMLQGIAKALARGDAHLENDRVVYSR